MEMQASDEMVDHSLLRASFAGDLEHMTARLELVGADGGAELGAALVVRPVHAAATRCVSLTVTCLSLSACLSLVCVWCVCEGCVVCVGGG